MKIKNDTVIPPLAVHSKNMVYQNEIVTESEDQQQTPLSTTTASYSLYFRYPTGSS